jgi:hypothetical protein
MKHTMLKTEMLAVVVVMLAIGAFAYPHNRAALAATQLYYYAREMLAALLVFSIGFAVVALMISILFLLDRGLYRASDWAGPYASRAAEQLHTGWEQVEQFGRKQFDSYSERTK